MRAAWQFCGIVQKRIGTLWMQSGFFGHGFLPLGQSCHPAVQKQLWCPGLLRARMLQHMPWISCWAGCAFARPWLGMCQETPGLLGPQLGCPGHQDSVGTCLAHLIFCNVRSRKQILSVVGIVNTCRVCVWLQVSKP